MEAHIEAHKYCCNHMEALKKDTVCGCFYCLKIFSPTEINEWLVDDNDADRFGTAICPHCGIDSVIGESSGYPITKDFLQKMYEYWF
ncbi:MAG: cytoplasmic protein [Oscillospiraceae bacterium]|nr:cytoplasmic protein [Oscillospiraceae bacterium]